MIEKDWARDHFFLRDKYLPIDGKFSWNETHPSPTLHQSTSMEERRRERLQMWGYRLLFFVTLITPWPNLFPQRSLEKLLGVLEKVQHSRCGPAATEGQATRCRAESRVFVRRWRRAAMAPDVVSSNHSVCSHGAADQTKATTCWLVLVL